MIYLFICIVSLETGLGKTFIAILVILAKAQINFSYNFKSQEPELQFGHEPALKRTKSFYRYKVLFLVPTKNLVEQQTEYIKKNLSKLQILFMVDLVYS